MDFWDDYRHKDPNIVYIFESIKTKQIEELSIDELEGCKCERQCTYGACSCCNRSGARYLFENKLLLQGYQLDIVDVNKPVYECNGNCKCQYQLCGNKLVQFGPRKCLQIVKTSSVQSDAMPSRGYGLITKEKVERNNFICEYAGELLEQSDTIKRYDLYKQKGLSDNYIFCIKENFGEKCNKTFIDPTYYGNIGRYINHSCQPNCMLVPIRIHDIIPKLCIFTQQHLTENTELTFDYGQSDTVTCTNSQGNKICLCGADNCRKFLPFDETT